MTPWILGEPRPGAGARSGSRFAARHASYLRLLNGEVPFPEPFDEPKAPRQVCEMVDPFITESPFNLKAFCESLPNKVITL
jgi:hypothetical protein